MYYIACQTFKINYGTLTRGPNWKAQAGGIQETECFWHPYDRLKGAAE